jgi:hypothetical protein
LTRGDSRFFEKSINFSLKIRKRKMGLVFSVTASVMTVYVDGWILSHIREKEHTPPWWFPDNGRCVQALIEKLPQESGIKKPAGIPLYGSFKKIT